MISLLLMLMVWTPKMCPTEGDTVVLVEHRGTRYEESIINNRRFEEYVRFCDPCGGKDLPLKYSLTQPNIWYVATVVSNWNKDTLIYVETMKSTWKEYLSLVNTYNKAKAILNSDDTDALRKLEEMFKND